MDRKATPKWAWLYYPFADRVHPLYVSTKLVKVRGPGGSAPGPLTLTTAHNQLYILFALFTVAMNINLADSISRHGLTPHNVHALKYNSHGRTVLTGLQSQYKRM